jgi:hypothetical protein
VKKADFCDSSNAHPIISPIIFTEVEYDDGWGDSQRFGQDAGKGTGTKNLHSFANSSFGRGQGFGQYAGNANGQFCSHSGRKLIFVNLMPNHNSPQSFFLQRWKSMTGMVMALCSLWLWTKNAMARKSVSAIILKHPVSLAL